MKGERVSAAVILDLIIGGLSHNLRIKLDVEYYECVLLLTSDLACRLTITDYFSPSYQDC